MRKVLISILIISLSFNIINSQEDINDLKEHLDSVCQEPDHKHYSKLTLAHITPWNKNGLDLTLKYSAKFDFVSPCWFEIKQENFQGKFNSKIEGANNVNMNYMAELREMKPNIKILPRFKCEGFNMENYDEFLKEENANQFIKILMRRLKHNKLDGLVLECNHIWILEQAYPNFAIMLKKLFEALKKENKMLILTIFPYSESFVNYITKIRFEYMSKYVDYFSVMTYDYLQYLNRETIAPTATFNAPISWIKKTLEYYVDYSKPNKDELLSKILLGLPFHGFVVDNPKDKKGKLSVLDSSTFIDLVQKGQLINMEWDKTECEHLMQLDLNNREAFAVYPTKKFFKERLEFSKENNLAGVSVWDLAQGMESFLDEF